MEISECKKYKIFPKKGTPVQVTISDYTVLPEGRIVRYHNQHRSSGTGTYVDFVAGSSGDLWWINVNGYISMYSPDEVSDI